MSENLPAVRHRAISQVFEHQPAAWVGGRSEPVEQRRPRWRAAFDTPAIDPVAVREAAAAMRRIQDGPGHSQRTAEASELVLAAVQAGAFSGTRWIWLRARLMSSPSFISLAFIIKDDPTAFGVDPVVVKGTDIAWGCPLVADALEREAGRLAALPQATTTTDSTNADDDWGLRITEAAEALGIDKGRIGPLVSSGKLIDNGKTGTERRISGASVVRYKRERELSAGEEPTAKTDAGTTRYLCLDSVNCGWTGDARPTNGRCPKCRREVRSRPR